MLETFLDAIYDYGIPSRVRGDRGGENRDVSILMILLRGLYRASFMWGSSTHNSRIERLWVEVGTQFARRWRAFFLRLEQHHYLDCSNPRHLWLIHVLFLDEINRDCESFRQDWNAHPLSGQGKGANQSPNVSTSNIAILCSAQIFNLEGYSVYGPIRVWNLSGGLRSNAP